MALEPDWRLLYYSITEERLNQSNAASQLTESFFNRSLYKARISFWKKTGFGLEKCLLVYKLILVPLTDNFCFASLVFQRRVVTRIK